MTLTRADVAHVVATVRAYHQAQDIGDATINAWHMAFTEAGMTSRGDAVHAVVRHYATPGADRWITPGDVIAAVRALRRDRLASSDQLLPDVNPDDVPGWLAARRAGVKALGDGTIPAPEAAPAQLDARVSAALPGVFRRPPRPLAITAEGGDRPAKASTAPRTVPEADAAAMEAERARQLAALAQLTAPTGDDTVAGRTQ